MPIRAVTIRSGARRSLHLMHTAGIETLRQQPVNNRTAKLPRRLCRFAIRATTKLMALDFRNRGAQGTHERLFRQRRM